MLTVLRGKIAKSATQSVQRLWTEPARRLNDGDTNPRHLDRLNFRQIWGALRLVTTRSKACESSRFKKSLPKHYDL